MRYSDHKTMYSYLELIQNIMPSAFIMNILEICRDHHDIELLLTIHEFLQYDQVPFNKDMMMIDRIRMQSIYSLIVSMNVKRRILWTQNENMEDSLIGISCIGYSFNNE